MISLMCLYYTSYGVFSSLYVKVMRILLGFSSFKSYNYYIIYIYLNKIIIFSFTVYHYKLTIIMELSFDLIICYE